MAAAFRACGLVLVRLGDGVLRSFGGGRPFAVFQPDLVNERNARIPDLGSIERQSPLPAQRWFCASPCPVTIRSVAKLTVEEARKLARQILGKVANGADPAAQKAEARSTPTVAELANLFLSDHVEPKRKRGTAAHYRDILIRIVIPEIGAQKSIE